MLNALHAPTAATGLANQSSLPLSARCPNSGSPGPLCQESVVAIGLLIAPDGRGTYVCAVVEPWNRLGLV